MYDIIVAGPNLHVINEVKQLLRSQFKLKDLGALKDFLGFEIARSSSGIVGSQRQYSLQLLQDYSFLEAKHFHTPMNSRYMLSTEDGEPSRDITHYRSLIGRWLYLMITRPNITYVIHALSQFLHAPKVLSLQAAHHLLIYIKSSLGLGL